MSNDFDRRVQEVEGSKKYIVFFFEINDEFCRNMLIYMQDLDVFSSYVITSYDSFEETMKGPEANKINDRDYLFWLVPKQRSDVCFLKSIKFLARNGIKNFELLSFRDYDTLNKRFYMNYLKGKGITVTGAQIVIEDFVFDNILLNDYEGVYQDVFNWGDLVLPHFFQDYSMIEEGAYEYDSVIMNPGDVVFDCGASIGSFSAFALSKKCEVHAFEPIAKTFSALQHNLRHYENEKQHLCNFGLSDRKDWVDFYVSNNTGSDGYLDSGNYKETISCYVTTIDEYIKENNIARVDFIKADIEGAERDMLVGAANTIKTFRPKLSLCTYHLHDDPKVIEEIIKNTCNSYNIIHKWGKCYAYV